MIVNVKSDQRRCTGSGKKQESHEKSATRAPTHDVSVRRSRLGWAKVQLLDTAIFAIRCYVINSNIILLFAVDEETSTNAYLLRQDFWE